MKTLNVENASKYTIERFTGNMSYLFALKLKEDLDIDLVVIGDVQNEMNVMRHIGLVTKDNKVFDATCLYETYQEYVEFMENVLTELEGFVYLKGDKALEIIKEQGFTLTCDNLNDKDKKYIEDFKELLKDIL